MGLHDISVGKESACNVVSYLGQENPPSYHTKCGRVEGHVLIFCCENSKMTTYCWTMIDRTLGPNKKNIPHIQGHRGSPRKTVWGENHIYNQTLYLPETLEGLKQNFVCIRTQRHHRDWADLPLSVWVSCRGMGQQQPAAEAGALGAATWVTQLMA